MLGSHLVSSSSFLYFASFIPATYLSLTTQEPPAQSQQTPLCCLPNVIRDSNPSALGLFASLNNNEFSVMYVRAFSLSLFHNALDSLRTRSPFAIPTVHERSLCVLYAVSSSRSRSYHPLRLGKSASSLLFFFADNRCHL